jgi:hypothetical protein
MVGLTNETPLNCVATQSTEETNMTDPTEPIRRQRLAEINAEPGSREASRSSASWHRLWSSAARLMG